MVRNQSPLPSSPTTTEVEHHIGPAVDSFGGGSGGDEDDRSSNSSASSPSIDSSVENHQQQQKQQQHRESRERERTPSKGTPRSRGRGRSRGENSSGRRPSVDLGQESVDSASFSSASSRSHQNSRSHNSQTKQQQPEQQPQRETSSILSTQSLSSTQSSAAGHPSSSSPPPPPFQERRVQSNSPLVHKRRTDTGEFSGASQSGAFSVPTTTHSSTTTTTTQQIQPRKSTGGILSRATPPRQRGTLFKTKSASSSSTNNSTPKRLLSRLFCTSQKEKLLCSGAPAFHLSPLDSFTSYDEHLEEQLHGRSNYKAKNRGGREERHVTSFPTTVGAFPTTVSEITSLQSLSSGGSSEDGNLSEATPHPSSQQIQHLRPVAEFSIATEAALASSPSNRLIYQRNMEQQHRLLHPMTPDSKKGNHSDDYDDHDDDDDFSTTSSNHSGHRMHRHSIDPTQVPLPGSPARSPSQESVPTSTIQGILPAASSDTIEELFLHASDSSQTESTTPPQSQSHHLTPNKNKSSGEDRTPRARSSSKKTPSERSSSQKRSDSNGIMAKAFLFPDVPTMSESPGSTPRASRTPSSAKRGGSKHTSRSMPGVDEDDDAFLPNALPNDSLILAPDSETFNILEEETYTWEQVQNHIREAEELVRKEMEEEHQFELLEFNERAETLFHEQNLKVQEERLAEQKRFDALLKEEKYKTQQKHRELINKVSVLSEMEKKVDQTAQERHGYLETIAKLQTKVQEMEDIQNAEDPAFTAAEQQRKELQRVMKEMERKHRGELVVLQDKKSAAVHQVQALQQQVQTLQAVVTELEQQQQQQQQPSQPSEDIEEIRRQHQEELHALQVKWDASDKKVFALNLQVEAMRSELNVDLRNDYQRVQRDKASAERKIQVLQAQLQEQRQQQQGGSDDGNEELKHARTEITTLKSELEKVLNLQAVAHNYEPNQDPKTNDTKMLQDQLQVAEEAVEVLRHKLQGYQRMEETAGGNLQQLLSNASQIASERDALKKQIDDLTQQQQQQQEQPSTLFKDQLKAAEETVAVLRNKLDTYSHLEKAVGGDLSIVKLEEIRNITAERDQLNSQIQQMSQDFGHQFQLAQKDAAQEIQKLKTQLEQAAAAAAVHSSETSTTQPKDLQTIENLQAQLEYLKQKHAIDLETARADALKESDELLDQLQEQLKQLEQQQASQYESAKRQGKEELASQLEALTQQLQSVRTESESERTFVLQEAEQKLEDYQRQMDAATVEHDQQLKKMQIDRDRIQQQLQHLQQRQAAQWKEAKQQGRDELQPQLQSLTEQVRSLRQESEVEMGDVMSKTSAERDLLRSQLEELKQLHLKELQAAQDTVKRETAKRDKTLEETMAQKQAEIDELQATHQTLMDRVMSQSKAEIASLQSQLTAALAQVEEEKIALTAATRKDTNAGEEIASLRKQYEAKIEHIRSETRLEVDNEIKLLRAKLDMAHVKYEKEKFDILESSERDCDALRVKLVTMRAEHLEQLEEAKAHNSHNTPREMEDLRRQLQQLQDQYNSCEQEFANKASAERSELEKYIVEMQGKYQEDLDEAAMEAKKELAIVRQQLETMTLGAEREKTALTETSKGLEAKLKTLQEIHDAELEGARIETRNQMEKELRELEQHVEAIQSDDGHLVQKIKVLEANAETYKTECERLVREIRADHGKQIEELLSQLDLVEAEHNERYLQKEKTVGEKDAVISALSNQLAESQTRLRDLSDRQAALDKEAVAAQDEVTKAQRELETNRQEIEQLQLGHQQALEAEVKLREKACNQAREEMIARAEIQFEQANATYKKLKHEYDTARGKISTLEREVKLAQKATEDVKKNQESRRVDLEDELAQAKAAIANIEATKARKVREFSHELDKHKEAEKDARSKLEDAQTALRNVESTLATVVGEKENLIREHDEMKAVCEELMAMVEKQQHI